MRTYLSVAGEVAVLLADELLRVAVHIRVAAEFIVTELRFLPTGAHGMNIFEDAHEEFKVCACVCV